MAIYTKIRDTSHFRVREDLSNRKISHKEEVSNKAEKSIICCIDFQMVLMIRFLGKVKRKQEPKCQIRGMGRIYCLEGGRYFGG